MSRELGRFGQLRRNFRAVGAVVVATLREIFDESAYARYLACGSISSSRENYAAFLREQAARSERRPRCC